ncbi:D-alanine--D-alanine ligase B [Anaerohalosphaera lusitana]|uniref:D-alanine--D-alanine ligase n=1 Tax=Anaerohalosphaera lusitana TaxID=1936003 RepID=A0A1U9NR32_9BACT|nr:D-alanine--D-alanine ligase [Anaerohalosphaera lusitana]AQT70204.1 D-alanine--D-alanine ligase B [Anaerohalosphaera lusitana]
MSPSLENLKVAVLMGGISSEREISLESGSTVAGSLAEAGLDVVEFDVAPDRLSILDDESVDVFFPILHGEWGEDGQLQQILTDRGLCFTGSGPDASRIAMDKVACKKAVESKTDVPLAGHVELTSDTGEDDVRNMLASMGDKFVVKPPLQGSSVGVTVVQGLDSACRCALKTLAEYGNCMVEKFISGRELTVAVLDGQALPIIEIRSKTGFYDFNAKYVDNATEYLFDTIADQALVSRISDMALQCFDAVGCRHWGRIDFILSEDGTPYFLEINTLPGFTSHSLVPMAARKAGISAPELCTRIVEAAIRDHRES